MKSPSLPPETVKMVRKRDNGGCIRCGRRDLLNTHHRQPRGMGGTKLTVKNLPSNLITLCGSGVTGCHGWVESHRALAFDYGYLVHQASNPAQVAVRYPDGWYTLTESGERIPFGDRQNDHFMEGLFDVGETGGHGGGGPSGWGQAGDGAPVGLAWPPDPARDRSQAPHAVRPRRGSGRP